jgi:hypothetical protein
MKHFSLVCATVLALAGCSEVDHALDGTARDLGSRVSASQSLVILDGLSVINTQKTLDDHLVSLITGKDCSTVRASRGDHYCEDKPAIGPSVVRITFCYKSLAAVTCYDRPFERDADRLVGTRIDIVPVAPQ